MVCQARLGDMSCGHWIGVFYFWPVPLIEASPDTLSCWVRASRVGDKASDHIGWLFGVVPIPGTKHTPTASTGANETLINWKPAFRIGDSYSCGDTQCQGCCEHIDCK